MIILKSFCHRVDGQIGETYLSGIMEDGVHHTIRERQDFELRIAEPIEFNTDIEAIQFLDMFDHEIKHYSTGSKIFGSRSDSPRELFFKYEIEEL